MGQHEAPGREFWRGVDKTLREERKRHEKVFMVPMIETLEIVVETLEFTSEG